MKTKQTYTREQLEIELLKQSRDTIGETLKRLESKIDSQLHWTMGLLFGLYAMIITGLITALGHVYGLF